MITLKGEEKTGHSKITRWAIALFVVAGIFVPALFLTGKSPTGFVTDFIGGLVVGVPALILLAFLLRKSWEKIRPKLFRLSKESKRK
jgi:high-affinity Fe2+/Pb2+ permease